MQKIKVLFVCLGNICRSPTAEGLFIELVNKNELQDQILIDSAGTCNNHIGELPDSRMRKHASARGYDLSTHARQFQASDLKEFDYILAMDNSNYNNILSLDSDELYGEKVFMMCEFTSNRPEDEVPDPYWGGDEGFEQVIDILEEATEGLLERVRSDHQI